MDVLPLLIYMGKKAEEPRLVLLVPSMLDDSFLMNSPLLLPL
jgi:hypothetical protein